MRRMYSEKQLKEMTEQVISKETEEGGLITASFNENWETKVIDDKGLYEYRVNALSLHGDNGKLYRFSNFITNNNFDLHILDNPEQLRENILKIVSGDHYEMSHSIYDTDNSEVIMGWVDRTSYNLVAYNGTTESILTHFTPSDDSLGGCVITQINKRTGEVFELIV